MIKIKKAINADYKVFKYLSIFYKLFARFVKSNKKYFSESVIMVIFASMLTFLLPEEGAKKSFFFMRGVITYGLIGLFYDIFGKMQEIYRIVALALFFSLGIFASFLFCNPLEGAIKITLLTFCTSIILLSINSILFNYLQNKTPIIVVLENDFDIQMLNKLYKKYDVKAVLNIGLYDIEEKTCILTLKEELINFLIFRSKFSFFQQPKKIICINKSNTKFLTDILNIAVDFSIPFYYVHMQKNFDNHTTQIAYEKIKFYDIINNENFIKLSQRTMNAFSDFFYQKNVCINYSGKKHILQFIDRILMCDVAGLTVFCKSEKDFFQIYERSLHFSNISIIIGDVTNVFEFNKPDVILLDLDMQKSLIISDKICEQNLVQIAIKKIKSTCNFLQKAIEKRVGYIYLLSNYDAVDSKNLLGATLKFIEIFAQSKDTSFLKTNTRITPIRLPEILDGFFGLITQAEKVIEENSINNQFDANKQNNHVDLKHNISSQNDKNQWNINNYSKHKIKLLMHDETHLTSSEVTNLLIESIMMSRSTKEHSEVYTILPYKENFSIHNVLKLNFLSHNIKIEENNIVIDKFLELNQDLPQLEKEKMKKSKIDNVLISKLQKHIKFQDDIFEFLEDKKNAIDLVEFLTNNLFRNFK